MYVNSVSFGKVFKVNAPLEVAEEIASKANRRSKTTQPQKQIKKIINDTKKGRAYAYAYDANSDVSYIFSGPEGRIFRTSQCEALAAKNKAQIEYGDDLMAKISASCANDEHYENVQNLISNSKVKNMGVEYDAKWKVSSVYLMA